MKYRGFGKLGWKASVLGFGAMRLPTISGQAAKIDEPQATKMIRYAIDHGVNYLDTAYPYHGGNGETFVGKVLGNGYREKVRLATKMPTWLVNSQADMDKYLDEQLARLQMDYVDFYLLHGLTGERWRKLTDMNVLRWLEGKVDEKKIGHIGFSFHDNYEDFKKIIDSYDGWTLCQIQYNYMDADYQAGTKGLRYAASKGLAVVVMEPIAGGRLSMNPPKEIQAIWDKADVKRSPAEWALRWVWNHPEVSVALSGMSTIEQVIENVKTADSSDPKTLKRKELALINRVSREYKKQGFIGCTGCGYCTPCPEGVSIPRIISLYNEFFMKDRDDAVKKKYHKQVAPEGRVSKCARCGKCEELCPQHIPIREILSRAKWIFEMPA